MTTGTKVWHEIRNDAGLPWLRLYDLRHNFASMLVNSGRTLYEVQQILGHSDSKLTGRDMLTFRPPWRCAIAIINPDVKVECIEAKSLVDADPGEFGASRLGTIAVATLLLSGADPIFVASMYAP